MDHQQKDETAVAYLATAMNTKLARARAKGRSGWDSPECTQQHLSNLLREHVEKGDPVDVANYCAFLAARGEGIAPRQCLAKIKEPAQPVAPVLDDRWKARMLDGRAIERDEMGLGDHPELPLLDEGMMPRSFFAALGLELAHTSAEDQLDGDVLGAMSEAVNWSRWMPTAPKGDGWKLVSIFDTEDGPVAWWLRELPEAEDGTTTIRILQAEVEKLKARIARAGAAPAAVAGPTDADLRKALQFYANGEHFILSERDTSWDTVSGEPQNYWCDEAGTATVEDGTIAKMALAGQPIDFEEDDAAPTLEAPADPASDEEAAFTKWFQGEQGKPYQGMWEFARAAWMARAATAAAPQAPAAPSKDAHVFTTPYPELNDLLRETSFQASEGANMDGAMLWLESLERVLALLAAPAAPALGRSVAQAVQALQEMWDDLEKSGSPRVNARAMRYYSDALSTVERALAGPAEPVESAEPVTPPVIDAKAMKEAFDCATAEGKSFNDALRAAACATIWRRAKRPDGAPDAVGAALVSIAVDCALHAEERHSYLPNTPAQAATWRPHEWVLKAMSRAISFDHMMNQAAPAAPAVDAPLTDDEIEGEFNQAGGKWTGDYWKIEDADLHPYARRVEQRAVLAERERICAAIKSEDDHCATGDYMLDSDDCIKVARGEWERPVYDSHPAAQAAAKGDNHG